MKIFFLHGLAPIAGRFNPEDVPYDSSLSLIPSPSVSGLFGLVGVKHGPTSPPMQLLVSNALGSPSLSVSIKMPPMPTSEELSVSCTHAAPPNSMQLRLEICPR